MSTNETYQVEMHGPCYLRTTWSRNRGHGVSREEAGRTAREWMADETGCSQLRICRNGVMVVQAFNDAEKGWYTFKGKMVGVPTHEEAFPISDMDRKIRDTVVEMFAAGKTRDEVMEAVERIKAA